MSGHKNPIKLALWESLRIEPSLSKPDLVVSMGTGTKKDPNSSTEVFCRHVLFDGFIPRLWRAYKSSFDGESNFRDIVNGLDRETREDYMRLNVVLPSNEPAIDNTSRMGELRQLVDLHPQINQKCEDIIYALLIATFYFELSCIPRELPPGQILCQGTIRCRLPGKVIVELLERIHPSPLCFVIHNRSLGSYNGQLDLCSSCTRYRKSVKFTVRDLGQLTTMYVKSSSQLLRKISAFPQTIKWFIDKQQLDAPFGTTYHKGVRHCSCKSCSDVGVKRKAEYKPPKSRKKRRLY